MVAQQPLGAASAASAGHIIRYQPDCTGKGYRATLVGGLARYLLLRAPASRFLFLLHMRWGRLRPMGNAMMWGVFLKTASPRTGLTRTLGRFSRRAFYGSLAPLRMQRIAIPPLPGTQWVRVRNHIAGVSQRDLATIQLLSNPAVSLAAMRHPRRLYLGHQVVGEVIEVGPACAVAPARRPGRLAVRSLLPNAGHRAALPCLRRRKLCPLHPPRDTCQPRADGWRLE